MAAPRYAPRDYTVDPAVFGKTPTVSWKKPGSAEEAALIRAAQLQHLYAYRIRAAAKAKKFPLAEFARQAGFSHVRLQRCLRGEIVMRLDDLGWADLILGGISEVAIQNAQAQKARESPKRLTL